MSVAGKARHSPTSLELIYANKRETRVLHALIRDATVKPGTASSRPIGSAFAVPGSLGNTNVFTEPIALHPKAFIIISDEPDTLRIDKNFGSYASRVIVTGEGGAADNIDTIIGKDDGEGNTGKAAFAGQILNIEAVLTTPLTLLNGTDIATPGGASFTIKGGSNVTLIYDSTQDKWLFLHDALVQRLDDLLDVTIGGDPLATGHHLEFTGTVWENKEDITFVSGGANLLNIQTLNWIGGHQLTRGASAPHLDLVMSGDTTFRMTVNSNIMFEVSDIAALGLKMSQPIYMQNENLFFDFPSGTRSIKFDGTSSLDYKVPAANNHRFFAGVAQRFGITDANVVIDTVPFDFGEITIPSNPAANFGRMYAKDVGGTHSEPFWLDELGTESSMLAANDTPWTVLHDAAGNELINLLFLESNATNPASAGFIRMGNLEDLRWRNFGNTADEFLTLDNDDVFLFSDAIKFETTLEAQSGKVRLRNADLIAWRNAADGNDITISVNSSSEFVFTHSGVIEYTFGTTELDLNGNAIRNANFFELDGLAAAVGQVRLRNSSIIAWRNNANSADENIQLDVSDNFLFSSDIDLFNNNLLRTTNIELRAGFNVSKLFFDGGGDTYFTGSGTSGRINIFNDASNNYTFTINEFSLFNSKNIALDGTTGGFIQFKERVAPGGVADVARLYSKDVAGLTELFYVNSAGTERDLSAVGGGSSFDDAAFDVHDDGTPAKIFKFALDGMADGTTLFDINNTTARVITFPDTSGTVAFTNVGQTWSSTQIFTGFTDLQGNVDLGDAIGDSITFQGRVDSNVLPNVASVFDLGSPSLKWLQVVAIILNFGVSDGSAVEIRGNTGGVEYRADVGDTHEWFIDGNSIAFFNSTILDMQSHGIHDVGEIRVDSAKVRAFTATEIGYFVTNFSGSVGAAGSVQIPSLTGSSSTAAQADTDFGSATGCIGYYQTSRLLCVRQSGGTWDGVIISGDVLV